MSVKPKRKSINLLSSQTTEMSIAQPKVTDLQKHLSDNSGISANKHAAEDSNNFIIPTRRTSVRVKNRRKSGTAGLRALMGVKTKLKQNKNDDD